MESKDGQDEKRTATAQKSPRGPKALRERSRSPRNHPRVERRYRDRTRDREEPLHDASNRHKGSEKYNEEKRLAKALFSKDKSKPRRHEDEGRKDRGRDHDGQREDSDRRDRYREDGGDGKRSSNSRRDDRDQNEPIKRNTDQSVRDKFGDKAGVSTKDNEKKQKPTPQPQSSEPMIVVTVNDRLGTKAQIPCFASDNVGLFKAQVAQRIGRKPHEIMLKRQGERPFKDMLSLEDYGVSSGVQLDLELDTGD